MNGAKRPVAETSDALGLLRKVASVVSAEVYDVIVQVLIDVDGVTDGSIPQQLIMLEETLEQNLAHFPELLNEFKNLFSEECQSVVKKAKKESKSSLSVDIPDPKIRVKNLQRLKKQLYDAQKCNFEEALDLNKKTNRCLEIPDLMSRFEQCIESLNKREINMETFLEQILMFYIGNEHLLPQLAEFLILDDQDLEAEKVLVLFKKKFQKYDYTSDAEKLVNHHSKYVRRLEREVNNISAFNRVKALLVLLNLEIVDLEQLKTMLSIGMKNEPPSAMDTLKELFDNLENLEYEDTANKNKLLHELEDSESLRRDYYLKPTNQLNLERMEPCTTSYAFLPLDYPIPKASGRTKLGDSVLNDRIIVISRGAENVDEESDNSVHENRIFELEDEIHDALRMLDLMKMTLKVVEENLVLIRGLTEEEASVLMNQNFNLKTIHLTCIRSLFQSEIEDLIESVKAHPEYNFRVMAESLTLKISEWKRHLANLKQKWQQSYQKNFMESLDQSNEGSLSPEVHHLRREHLLKEISEASNHSSESRKKSKIQMIDFEECRNKSDMILDFSNSLMGERELCFWTVEEAIKASYEGPGLTNRCLVWQRFILAFFQVDSEDQNTNSVSERTNPLRRQSSSKFIMLRQLMKELSETGETYCCCSESLYCLFRYLSILCSRLRLLRSAQQQQQDSKTEKIKTVISDFLCNRIHRPCFEEELTKLAGMKIGSLFAIPHLLKKIIAPMEKLLMHPVTALLEEQAKCLLSTPEDQSETLLKKQSFNELKSLMKLQSLCPGKRLFRVAYDLANEKLKIKEVTKKAKALPEMQDSMGCFKSGSKSKSKTQKQSPLFLNRNLKGVCSPRWPKYLLHEHLIHEAESDRIAYDRAREDWMISLRRQLPNYALIEAKSITVSNWISQCTAGRLPVSQTRPLKSKGGVK